jgi:hypothetical protein
MKFKAPKPDTNFWIIVGTITFFILSYFIYIKYYVPNKEHKIISTRFRVLDQLGDNINAKIASYNYNVLSLENKIQDTVKSLEDQFKLYNFHFSKEEIVPFILAGFVQGNYKEFLNKDLQVTDFKLDLGGNGTNTAHEYQVDKPLVKTETDKYYYFRPLAIKTDSEDKGKKVSFYDSVLVRVKYESIMSGLTRDDVFDGMFIIRNGEFIYTTLQSDLLLDKTSGSQGIFGLIYSYQESPKPADGKDAGKPGPKLALPQRMISGEYSAITISNKEYKLFFKPVNVEGEYWFLGGLMETGNFNATSKSIPQRLIIVLSLVLILIILGMPLIKLKVISKTEHLKAGTIVNAALAIMLGISVLTLFMLYLSQNALRKRNADDRLIKMSQAINTSFTGELTDAFNQLAEIDRRHEGYQFDLISQGNNKPIIENILNLPDGHPARPDIYPYADYIFWADGNGVQSAFLTHFRKMTGEMPNVKQRDYFNKKDEWFFPPDPSEKFRFESILSFRNGDHKLAISKKSDVRKNPVIALTSKFYSIIETLIPKNFGYCIIDEKGKVWFHSNKDRNLMENFIDECNENKNLKAAIYSRTSKALTVTYYNKKHRAYIRPLDQLPLYLITFYNWDTETSFQSQVFTMSIVFNITFFIFIFLQILLILFLEQRYHENLTKNLIMKITRPMVHLAPHYLFLVKVYLAVTILTALGIYFVGKTQAFAAIYMVGIIIFAFSFKVLNDNELKAIQHKWFTRVNYFILFLMNVVLFISTDKIIALLLIAFQLILIIALERAYLSFKRKLNSPELSFSSSLLRKYVMYLLSIAILFSILPTMIFYEIAYNYESEVRLRHYQADLMKKREERNTKWNIFYAPMLDSPYSESILQVRKNLGIYTDFYNGLAFAGSPVSRDEKETFSGSVLDSMLLFLRPYYDDEVVENKFLITGNQANSQKYWTKYGEDSLVLNYISNTEDPGFKKQELVRITGQLEIFSFLLPYHQESYSDIRGMVSNAVFWITFLMVLFIFFHLIRFGVRRIYSLDIVANFNHLPFGDFIRHLTYGKKGILAVKLSPKDETHLLKEVLHADVHLNWSDQAEIADSVRRIEEKISAAATKDEPVTVFIDQFEWSFAQPGILKEKLEILLKYTGRLEVHLVVLSAEEPSKIIAFYQEMTERSRNAGQEDKAAANADMGLYNQIVNDLKRMISQMVINPLPVKSQYNAEDKINPCVKPEKKYSPEDLMVQELNATDYLLQFKETVNAYYEINIRDNDQKNQAEMILDKIVTLAGSYYEDLLNSCSPEEQYVLYDLSGDLIMNQKNSMAIFGLLEKGILVKDCDRINFMNASFRRFIIARRSKTDTAELEARIGKKTGTWQGYKIMFILIIVSLFIFIAVANQDFLKNLQQIFVVIGGGIAAITGMLGLLSRTGKPASP